MLIVVLRLFCFPCKTLLRSFFFCLAGLTAVELSGRQAGYEDYPGCSRHLLGPAESVFAVKQTKVACNIEIKIQISAYFKGLFCLLRTILAYQ